MARSVPRHNAAVDGRWPPLVAAGLALLVFLGALLALPPGPAAVQEVLVGGALLPSGAAAAYTASIAATLALLTLAVAALVLGPLPRRLGGLLRRAQERLQRPRLDL
jgi:hypothetical protein